MVLPPCSCKERSRHTKQRGMTRVGFYSYFNNQSGCTKSKLVWECDQCKVNVSSSYYHDEIFAFINFFLMYILFSKS